MTFMTSFASASSNTTSFPQKLFSLVEHESSEVVCWTERGLSFKVVNVDRFADEIVPKYFRHTKMTSFQRQLNLYGFRRITKGEDVGAYFHPKFQRGRRDLLGEIKRLPGKSTFISSFPSIPSITRRQPPFSALFDVRKPDGLIGATLIAPNRFVQRKDDGSYNASSFSSVSASGGAASSLAAASGASASSTHPSTIMMMNAAAAANNGSNGADGNKNTKLYSNGIPLLSSESLSYEQLQLQKHQQLLQKQEQLQQQQQQQQQRPYPHAQATKSYQYHPYHQLQHQHHHLLQQASTQSQGGSSTLLMSKDPSKPVVVNYPSQKPLQPSVSSSHVLMHQHLKGAKAQYPQLYPSLQQQYQLNGGAYSKAAPAGKEQAVGTYQPQFVNIRSYDNDDSLYELTMSQRNAERVYALDVARAKGIPAEIPVATEVSVAGADANDSVFANAKNSYKYQYVIPSTVAASTTTGAARGESNDHLGNDLFYSVANGIGNANAPSSAMYEAISPTTTIASTVTTTTTTTTTTPGAFQSAINVPVFQESPMYTATPTFVNIPSLENELRYAMPSLISNGDLEALGQYHYNQQPQTHGSNFDYVGKPPLEREESDMWSLLNLSDKDIDLFDIDMIFGEDNMPNKICDNDATVH